MRCSDVRYHPFQQAGIGLHRREIIGYVDLDLSVCRAAVQDRLSDDRIQRDCVEMHAERASLDAAQRQQVLHQVDQLVAGCLDGAEQLGLLLGRQVDVLLPQAGHGGLDPGGVRRSWPTAASSAERASISASS